jgi:hypothetical protein
MNILKMAAVVILSVGMGGCLSFSSNTPGPQGPQGNQGPAGSSEKIIVVPERSDEQIIVVPAK